jgi:ankyrin repeat protein
MNPILQASAKGYTEIARMLLKAEANPNARKTSGEKETALMYASQRGHEEIIKLLIEAKAELNIKNESGKAALAMAEQNGFVEITNILKKAGAK